MKLKDLLHGVGGHHPPKETYVDGASVPAEPEGPYRARMEHATHHAAPEGIDVREREVVTAGCRCCFEPVVHADTNGTPRNSSA